MAGPAFLSAAAQGMKVPGRPDPTAALAEFLGLHQGDDPSTSTHIDANGYSADPALQLASLRDARKGELEDRLINDRSTGDAGDGIRAKSFLDLLSADQSSDPYTGDAARAAAQKTTDQRNAMSAQENPNSPEGRAQAHQEAIELQKSMVEHPNPNVSPFGGSNIPNVPGGVPSGGSGSGGGNTMSMGSGPAPQGVDPSKWAAHTSDLTPDAAAKVAALLKYDLPIPSGNVLARPEYSAILGRAMQIDPTFDYKQYDARKSYLQDFAKGQTGRAVTGLDTVMHHLDSFNDAAEGLHNSGFKPWNYLSNEALSATVGNPAVGRFDEASNAVSGELSNVFKATGATDSEIKSWRDHLSMASTPDEFKSRVSELTDLINGRMQAVGKHYKDVMGHDAPDFLSPESRDIWKKFQQPGSSQSPQQAPGALPAGVSVHRIG